MDIKKIIKEELDDFDWIRQHSFHLDLMGQNPKEINSLYEVKKILFNPAVITSNQKFKNVAYYLEDMDYMPRNLIFDEQLSYIEITKHPLVKFGGRTDGDLLLKNGEYFVGTSVGDDELIKMNEEEGSFWYEEFMKFKLK